MGITINLGGLAAIGGRHGGKKGRAISLLIVAIFIAIVGIGIAISSLEPYFNSYLEVSQAFDYSQSGDTMIITGEVTNKTDKTLVNVDFKLTFDGEEDGLDYSGYYNINNITIEAGGTYRIEEILDADGVTYTSIDEVEFRVGNGDWMTLYENGSIGFIIVGGVMVLVAVIFLICSIVLFRKAKKEKEMGITEPDTNGWGGGNGPRTTMSGTTTTTTTTNSSSTSTTTSTTYVEPTLPLNNQGRTDNNITVCPYCGTKNTGSTGKCSGCGSNL